MEEKLVITARTGPQAQQIHTLVIHITETCSEETIMLCRKNIPGCFWSRLPLQSAKSLIVLGIVMLLLTAAGFLFG